MRWRCAQFVVAPLLDPARLCASGMASQLVPVDVVASVDDVQVDGAQLAVGFFLGDGRMAGAVVVIVIVASYTLWCRVLAAFVAWLWATARRVCACGGLLEISFCAMKLEISFCPRRGPEADTAGAGRPPPCPKVNPKAPPVPASTGFEHPGFHPTTIAPPPHVPGPSQFKAPPKGLQFTFKAPPKGAVPLPPLPLCGLCGDRPSYGWNFKCAFCNKHLCSTPTCMVIRCETCYDDRVAYDVNYEIQHALRAKAGVEKQTQSMMTHTWLRGVANPRYSSPGATNEGVFDSDGTRQVTTIGFGFNVTLGPA